MKHTDEDIKDFAVQTLDHYNQRAEDFFAGTIDHDVEQNILALLRYIKGDAPFTILDFGCGPGRDLKTFSDRGHIAIGLDGASQFVKIARSYSGCDVWLQDFFYPNLPANRFDGIFANASLFHLPSQELPRILQILRTALKSEGVIFSSNPRGNNEEGWNRGRYGAYYNLETWRNYMVSAGFIELTHYYRPAGVPHEQQPWLASVWRKGNTTTDPLK